MDHPKDLQQAAAEDSTRKLKPHARAHFAYVMKHGQPLTVPAMDVLMEHLYSAGYKDGLKDAMKVINERYDQGYDDAGDGLPYTPPKQTEHAALSADDLEVLP